MGLIERLRQVLQTQRSGGRESAELRSLSAPIDAVLAPFGFVRVEVHQLGSTAVGGDWASNDVLVSVSFEPKERWGHVAIGRRLRDVPLSTRSMANLVMLDAILESRELVPAAPVSGNWTGSNPASIGRWADAVSGDLLRVRDVLEGENLELIDRLLAEPTVRARFG